MKIKKFVFNPFSENTYIYFDENTLEGVIIDPGMSNPNEETIFKEFTDNNKIKIKYIVNTHGHIDHILGNRYTKEIYGVPLLLNKDDEFLFKRAKEQAYFFNVDYNESPKPDTYIDDKLKFHLGETELEFISTPGHSPGGVCIIDKKNKNIFCGDLIFQNSVGRTDLPGGDYDILLDSILNKLFKECGDDYELHPGHMESTTVGEKKKFNPFLK